MLPVHNLMQGSLALPQRVSLHSLAVVQSRTFAPEQVGVFRLPHLQTYNDCKPDDLKDFRKENISIRSIERVNSTEVVNDLCFGTRVKARGLSLALNAGIRKMRGSTLASLASCSYASLLNPAVSDRSTAIHGQILDYSSWKSLVTGIPGPLRHEPAFPWYCPPSGVLRGLRTKNFNGLVPAKKVRQDLLVKDSNSSAKTDTGFQSTKLDKDEVLYSSDSESESEVDKEEKFARIEVIGSLGQSGRDEENWKEQKKGKKLKPMRGQGEDSESDSDDDEKEKPKKGVTPNGKVEIVGMDGEDSDSERDDNEEKGKEKEKEMKKKMKEAEKELKRLAKAVKKEKKEMKAKMKMKEESDSEGEDKKKEENKKMLASKDEEWGAEFDYDKEDDIFDVKSKVNFTVLKENASATDSDHEGEDDEVDVVADSLNVDELEEDDFELVGDEDLVDGMIEKEFECSPFLDCL